MKKKTKTSALERELLTTFSETKNFIVNKYYNAFMNKLGVKGADYQQRDFMLRQFWATGTIAMFVIQNSQTEETPQGLAVFCPYAPIDYNMYDFPVHCTLVNKRGVPFIPSGSQTIDKDVCIGFIQRNHKGIKFIVDYYAKRIALIKSVMQTQLIAKKMPFILATTPENKERLEDLWNDILSDNPALFADFDVIQNINALNLTSTFEIDKLQNMADNEENNLKEILGIDNLGVHEKKEHLINKEIEANNQQTEDSASCIIDCLEEFSECIKKTFNYELKFEWKNSIQEEKNEGSFKEEQQEEEM